MASSSTGRARQSAETSIRPGDLIGGKYRIERLIGVGGMAAVYDAKDERLDRHVAIKTLLPEALLHAGTVERFAREARASARLKSENVVRIVDVDTLPDGSPYMVMELLEGKDLREHLMEAGPLAVPSVVDWILQACDGIAEAHAAGIVHRDLKPANLFLAKRSNGSSTLKVLDFGVAKHASETGPNSQEFDLTRTFDVVGSPHYMSPEQIVHAKQVDSRADIWALGVCLYRLIANDSPFNGSSFPQLCMGILESTPIPLSEHRTDVPEGLAAVVKKCLEKKPADRYQTAAELAQALRPYGLDAAGLGSIAGPYPTSETERARRAEMTPIPISTPSIAKTSPAAQPNEPHSQSTAAWRGLVRDDEAVPPPHAAIEVPKKRRLPWTAVGAMIAIAGLGIGAASVKRGAATTPSTAGMEATLPAPIIPQAIAVVAPPAPEKAPDVIASAPADPRPAPPSAIAPAAIARPSRPRIAAAAAVPATPPAAVSVIVPASPVIAPAPAIAPAPHPTPVATPPRNPLDMKLKDP